MAFGQISFSMRNTSSKEAFKLINSIRMVCMYSKAILYCHKEEEILAWLAPSNTVIAKEGIIFEDLNTGPVVYWFGMAFPIVADSIYVPSGRVKVHFE